MNNIPAPCFYQNQINTYSIARISVDPDSINGIWENIKKEIELHLKNKTKNVVKIIDNNRIIGLECKDLNVVVRFYTCTMAENSDLNNYLMIQNVNNKKDETYITSINCVSNKFYNNIRINDSILNIPTVA